MLRQELAPYIKQKLIDGVKKEQIVETLKAESWNIKDIEAAFTNVNVEAQINSAQKSGKRLVKIAISIPIILLIIVGIVAYALYLNNNNESNSNLQESGNLESNAPSDSVNSDQSTSIIIAAPARYELDLLNKLLECSSTRISKANPITGAIYEKRVVGLVDGLCNYTEQLPNKSLMECNYNEEERAAIVEMYRSINETNSNSVEIKVNITPDNNQTFTANNVDGQGVSNLLLTALENGTCVVSSN